MAQLTAEQVNQLAGNFLAIAQSVGNYRYAHYGELDEATSKQLRDLHWALLKYADDLFTQSAQLVMNQAKASLQAITDITEEIKTSYQALKNIQKAIDIATTATMLGTAIMSKNPAAIVTAIQQLEQAWKA